MLKENKSKELLNDRAEMFNKGDDLFCVAVAGLGELLFDPTLGKDYDQELKSNVIELMKETLRKGQLISEEEFSSHLQYISRLIGIEPEKFSYNDLQKINNAKALFTTIRYYIKLSSASIAEMRTKFKNLLKNYC